MGVVDRVTDAVAGAPKMANQMMASDLIGLCKLEAAFFTTATLEASTQEVRHFFTRALNHVLESHEQISKIAEDKGWYRAHLSPVEQVRDDLKSTESIPR